MQKKKQFEKSYNGKNKLYILYNANGYLIVSKKNHHIQTQKKNNNNHPIVVQKLIAIKCITFVSCFLQTLCICKIVFIYINMHKYIKNNNLVCNTGKCM